MKNEKKNGSIHQSEYKWALYWQRFFLSKKDDKRIKLMRVVQVEVLLFYVDIAVANKFKNSAVKNATISINESLIRHRIN